MELTKELKEKVEKAQSKEEAKKILKEAGLELWPFLPFPVSET